MSLEEKHYATTLVSDTSGKCRRDYVAPTSNATYRCPIPLRPNPHGRGGIPINSNGLYGKFKTHIEQHHKNLTKGIEITTVTREGNARVYSYPRPTANPPRKRNGMPDPRQPAPRPPGPADQKLPQQKPAPPDKALPARALRENAARNTPPGSIEDQQTTK